MVPSEDTLIAEMESGFSERNLQKVAANIKLCASAYPQSDALPVYRGKFAFTQGNIISGTKLLRAAAQLTINHPTVWHTLYQALREFELLFPLYHFLSLPAPCPLTAEQQLERVGIALKTGNIQQGLTILEELQLTDKLHADKLLYQGHLYKALADVESAAKAYHSFIANRYGSKAIGYWSLADLKQYVFSQDDISNIDQLMGANTSATSMGLLHLALSRAYEQRGNYSVASKHLLKGNELISQSRTFSASDYKKIISQNCNWKPQNLLNNNKQHIFIMGLPRSGTTLTEQILAAHTNVQPTDELPFMERLALQASTMGPYPHVLNQFPPSIKSTFYQFYDLQIQDYAPGFSGRFIDKNPNNFLHIGLIKSLIPNAKCILISRPVADTIISLLRQHFSKGNDYAYNIDNIISYIDGFYQLIDHWVNQFHNELFLIRYECLVTKPRESIKTLIEYCELPVEENCFHFYNSSSPVLTPSASQVKQPIHTNNINSSAVYDVILHSYQEKIAEMEALRTSLFPAM